MITNFKIFENLDPFTQKVLNIELLKYSSSLSSLETMRNLIKAGADVNYNNINDGTPLMNAAKKMFYSGIKLLIDNGADVNIKNNKNDETALMYISLLPTYTLRKNINNIKRIIDLFIEADVDLNSKTLNDRDLFYILGYSSELELTKYIQEKYPEKYQEYLIKKDSNKYNL